MDKVIITIIPSSTLTQEEAFMAGAVSLVGRGCAHCCQSMDMADLRSAKCGIGSDITHRACWLDYVLENEHRLSK